MTGLSALTDVTSLENTIYFDGGASPNPGAVTVALVCGDDRLLLHLDDVRGVNNVAEFQAAIVALDYAAAKAMHQPTMAGNSDAVTAAMGGGRPPKSGKLTSLFEKCLVKDHAIGGGVWRRVPRANPAGLLIQTERRARKVAQRNARATGR